jgi:RNA polymerase sigma-70 factor (ECF subfamily)
LDEQLLIQQLQLGTQDSYGQLVNMYQHLVYNTVLGIIHSNEDAEDVSQEVFIQVFQSIHQFKGESKLSTWLYRIAITKSIDWQRRKSRKKRFAIVERLFGNDDSIKHDPPEFHHPGVTIENKEKATLLFKAMEKLPENQKIAFALNKVEGLSYFEVATIMKVTEASVEALLHRAKQNLRKELANYYSK